MRRGPDTVGDKDDAGEKGDVVESNAGVQASRRSWASLKDSLTMAESPKPRQSSPEEEEESPEDSSSSAAKESSEPTPSPSGSSGGSADAGAAASCEETGKVETLEEHIAKHDYPKSFFTCGPCQLWKRIQESCDFQDACSYTNPMTSKKETWLGCRNGHAICIVCNSYVQQLGRCSWLRCSKDHKLSSLATGKACNLDLSRKRRWGFTLKTHKTQLGHREALQDYFHRQRAQAAQGAGDFAPTFATGAQAASAPQAASAQAASAQAASSQAAATGAQAASAPAVSAARAHAKRPRE